MSPQVVQKVSCAFLLISTLSYALPSWGRPVAGLPGRRVGGGTRGECVAEGKQFTALVPTSNLGKTTSPYPNLYFYLPTDSTPSKLEFVLRDSADRLVYETVISASQRSGIMVLDLASFAPDLPPLAEGARYQWYLSMLCDPQNRAQDVVLEGWLERSAPSAQLAQSLKQASQSEEASLYWQAGFWLDALDVIAGLRAEAATQPTLFQQWSALLNAVDLGAIATEPLLINSEQSLQYAAEVNQ